MNTKIHRLSRRAVGMLCATLSGACLLVSAPSRADDLITDTVQLAIPTIAAGIELINAVTCPTRDTVGCPNPPAVQPPTVSNPIDITGVEAVIGIGNIDVSAAVTLGTPGPLLASLSGCQYSLDFFLQHTEYPGYLLDYENCLKTYVPPAAVKVLPSTGEGIKFIAGLCLLQTKAFEYQEYIYSYPYYRTRVRSTGVTNCNTVTAYMTTNLSITTTLQDFMKIYTAGIASASGVNYVESVVDLVGNINSLVGQGVNGSNIAKVAIDTTISPVLGKCGTVGCTMTWVALTDKDVSTGKDLSCSTVGFGYHCIMNGIPMTDATIARGPNILQ